MEFLLSLINKILHFQPPMVTKKLKNLLPNNNNNNNNNNNKTINLPKLTKKKYVKGWAPTYQIVGQVNLNHPILDL